MAAALLYRGAARRHVRSHAAAAAQPAALVVVLRGVLVVPGAAGHAPAARLLGPRRMDHGRTRPTGTHEELWGLPLNG